MMKVLSFHSAAALILATSTAFAAITARDRVNTCILQNKSPSRVERIAGLRQCLKLHARPLARGTNLNNVAKCIENTFHMVESSDETIDELSWNKCVSGRAR